MPCIELIAEDALLIDLNDDFSNKALITDTLAKLHQFLKAQARLGVIDCIPAYTNLTVIVDFPSVLPQSLITHIHTWLKTNSPEESKTQKHELTLPCCYDAQFGLDLDLIAQQHQLTTNEVIHIHSTQRYRVYAIGFSPGFPYLGYVDPRIATPRKASPRTLVPLGSVGIADNQTGIYPQNSPGGWNIIGRCPTQLFNADAKKSEQLCPLNVGDIVRFQAINKVDYHRLGGE